MWPVSITATIRHLPLNPSPSFGHSSYERGGNLVFDNTKVGLSPSGRQLDFEARYQISANDNSELSFGAVVSRDYGHVANAKLEKQGFLTYRLKW